jgi:hypothetical protein
VTQNHISGNQSKWSRNRLIFKLLLFYPSAYL